MKMRKNLLLLGASLLALPALAQEGPAWSANVALSTDYVWRGISQSNEDFAISGGFDVSYGSFYAGTWASNVDFENASDTNLEIDFYGGFTGEFAGGVAWDVGLIYYTYPDSGGSDLDFLELKGGLSYEFESGLGVSGTAWYDPDNKNFYTEAGAGFSPMENFSVDATLGYYNFDAGGDYTNWTLGGTLSLPAFDVGVRYTGTDVDSVSIADDRIVLVLSRSL